MDNLLESIEAEYKNLCKYTYFFHLENQVVINLKFKKGYLPHLIGLHKLEQYYTEFRNMVDKNNVTVTAKNIFKVLKKNNITYETLKNGLGWTTHLENRMLNFTYQTIDSILRKTKIFSYIYNEEKTKNTKAKYVLIDKPQSLYLHLFIGYDEDIKSYYPNSFVADKEKDSNLSRDTIRILKTEIYKITPDQVNRIEVIEHAVIRDITNKLKDSLKQYNSNNNELYKLASENKPFLVKLNMVNDIVKTIKKDYDEFYSFHSVLLFKLTVVLVYECACCASPHF